VPIDVPVNVCGDGIDVIGVGDVVTGDDCDNNGGGHHHTVTPPRHHAGPPKAGHGTPGERGRSAAPGVRSGGGPVVAAGPAARTTGASTPAPQLAQTGSDLPMGAVLPIGAGALLAGAVLYRKARAAA
jgi:hypothetical protein